MIRKALSLQCHAKERAIFQPRHYRYYFFTVAIFSYPKRTSDQYRPIFLYDLLSLAIYADILKLHLDIPEPEATGWGRWKATVHIAGVHIRCCFPIDCERGVAYQHVPDGHLRKAHRHSRRSFRASAMAAFDFYRVDDWRGLVHRKLVEGEEGIIIGTALIVHIDYERAEIVLHRDIPEHEVMDQASPASPRLYPL